ncbi:MAG: lamin tail domain-containing protein, partial [Mycobacteriales bacterium]
MNLDAAARQAAGTSTTTYTEATTGAAGNDSFLEDSTLFASDVLTLHTVHGAAFSQSSVRLDGNFADSLAGQKWIARYTGRLDRSNTGIVDAWLSLAVGDQPDVTGPNSATADFALLLRGTAAWQTWADNTVLATGAAAVLRSPDLWSTPFTVTITVDETLGQPTAQVSVLVGANSFNLGTWNVAFDNATARFFELRAHNGGNTSAAGAIMDARVDVLVLTQVNNLPQIPSITSEPQSQTLAFADPLSLTVAASGSTPLSYQWSLNGAPIPSATSATYTVANARVADAGTYSVTVTNPVGSATTSAVVSVFFPTPAQATWETPGASNRRTGLTISEIHYHPETRADARDLQFVELYNSNPWLEELSGYRLSGDIDYVFPAGTNIPAKGRLVIAHLPPDVQATYGISGVLGPFSGDLSNEGGTLRLRKASDAIVVEVSWNDHAPWPVAADGTGHSLVLVRPSYGESDPRAWAASPVRGGSPGAGDIAPGSAQDFVVINEVLARSVPPLEDFVELHNHSPSSVDLGGCALSDDPAVLGKFLVPVGTILPAGGFVAFTETQLGFALRAQGETLYLTNAAGTRVLDAVRFGGQAADVSLGRTPNGEGDLRPLAARSPGAPNSGPKIPEVLISELFFNPISGNDLDEWLELANTGTAPVDVSGWRFVSGISFQIPAGTSIAGGGRLVVAKSAARTRANHPALAPALVVGDYEGTLGNGGDHVTLVRPEVVELLTIDVEIDSVRYREASRWNRWGDGGGSSLEATDLRADRSFAGAWADSDESAKAPWTTVSATGLLDLGYGGLAGADRVQLFMMGTGDALVDDIAASAGAGGNVVSNGGFENGLTGWIRQGNQVRSDLATGQGFGGGNALQLLGTDDGDPEGNRVYSALTATLAPNSSGSLSARARWLRGHPELILRLKGGYL